MQRTRLFLAVVSLALYTYQLGWAQNEDRDWVNKNYQAVLNEFLPIQKDSPGAWVGFRSHRDLYTDVLEYSFIFNKDYRDNRIEVTVRIADSVSLYDQMMTLHHKHPIDPIESVKKHLKVKEWHLTGQGCPVVRTWFKKFSKVRFSPSLPDLIVLHPMIYEFQMSAAAGDMKLTLLEDTNPLVVWAKNTRRAWEECITKRPFSCYPYHIFLLSEVMWNGNRTAIVR